MALSHHNRNLVMGVSMRRVGVPINKKEEEEDVEVLGRRRTLFTGADKTGGGNLPVMTL